MFLVKSAQTWPRWYIWAILKMFSSSAYILNPHQKKFLKTISRYDVPVKIAQTWPRRYIWAILKMFSWPIHFFTLKKNDKNFVNKIWLRFLKIQIDFQTLVAILCVMH